MASVTEPSSPNTTTQQQILFAIKLVLKLLGAFGIGWGAGVPADQWALVAGALTMLIEFGVSWWNTQHQAWLDHQGNVASARAAQATRVVAEKGGITDV